MWSYTIWAGIRGNWINALLYGYKFVINKYCIKKKIKLMYSFIYLFKMVYVAIYNITNTILVIRQYCFNLLYKCLYIYIFIQNYWIHHNTHNLNIKVVKPCPLFKYTIYFLYKTQIAMLLFGWTVGIGFFCSMYRNPPLLDIYQPILDIKMFLPIFFLGMIHQKWKCTHLRTSKMQMSSQIGRNLAFNHFSPMDRCSEWCRQNERPNSW